MTLTKISDADIGSLRVSSLPSRPTAPKSFGGSGYTAKQMKEAFDRLPLYIISRYNSLVEAIAAEGEEGISAMIPTGIREEHSLSELFSDVTTGAFADYLNVLGSTLSDTVGALKERLRALEGGLAASDKELDGSIDRIEGLEALLEADALALERVRSECEGVALALSAARELLLSADSELSERCDELERRSSTLYGEIVESKAALDVLIARIGSIDTAHANQLESALSELRRACESSVSEARAECEERIAELAAKISTPENLIIDCGGPSALAEKGE